MSVDDPFAEYVSKDVVVDTDGNIICIGTLVAVTPSSLQLADADLHSMSDTSATREVYVMEAAKLGTRSNRRKVSLMRSRVISVSLLDDVVKY